MEHNCARYFLNIDNWEALSKTVDWDRGVPLERWRERVSAGHRSYLPDAVYHDTGRRRPVLRIPEIPA
jgi:hypothetical protein